MITIFNRKELLCTLSAETAALIRNRLRQNGIDYRDRIVNRSRSAVYPTDTRIRTGTFGQNIDCNNLYYIYVHKQDFPKAQKICADLLPTHFSFQ